VSSNSQHVGIGRAALIEVAHQTRRPKRIGTAMMLLLHSCTCRRFGLVTERTIKHTLRGGFKIGGIVCHLLGSTRRLHFHHMKHCGLSFTETSRPPPMDGAKSSSQLSHQNLQKTATLRLKIAALCGQYEHQRLNLVRKRHGHQCRKNP
jgi:hypothetical protein